MQKSILLNKMQISGYRYTYVYVIALIMLRILGF